MTRSSVGNLKQKSPHLQLTRSAKKSTVKKAKPSFEPLSPHYEDFKSPPEIKSRFHSRRNAASRNLELEGTLRRAEESVNSALLQPLEEKQDLSITERNTSYGSRSGGYTPKGSSRLHSHVASTSVESEKNRSKENRFSVTSSSRKTSYSPSPSLEYTVRFEPGSIGLKVEPVIKNGRKEFGCRVMKFVEATTSPSQAKRSGQIKVGHVLTAVNGRNVTSKSYADIVTLLAECKTEGKSITFRVPRSPATSMPYTPSSSKGEFESLLSSIPSERNETQSPTTSITPPTIFSPSFVKKMSRTTLQDQGILPGPSRQPTKTVSDVLSNVVKNIAPASHEENEVFVPNMLSKRISEVLTGSHSVQFDETVQMKMELLTELSQAKATLGEQEENIKKMEQMVNTLNQEKITIRDEKEIAESTLTDVQKAKVRILSFLLIACYLFSMFSIYFE